MSSSVYIVRARRALKSSRLLLDLGNGGNGAGDRAFFAVLGAIRAVLSAHFGVDVCPKTHDGMEYLFHLHVVRAGLMDRALAKVIHEVGEVHRTDDRGLDLVLRERAEDLLPSVEKFVDACERLAAEVVPA
jgi:uncharacterized protein (UPF0332 family)